MTRKIESGDYIHVYRNDPKRKVYVDSVVLVKRVLSDGMYLVWDESGQESFTFGKSYDITLLSDEDESIDEDELDSIHV